MTNVKIPEASSYKDPDSAVFYKNNEVYRERHFSYKDNYDKLMLSGLYKNLTENNLLIQHSEVENTDNSVYKIIKPEKIFITYPWEWCFSELKDAALATLKIQLTALNYGMSLKDANCYNIQFKKNKPLLIDTASFENYNEGDPWTAYKQFCENFLAPLALMAYSDISLNKLLITNINGIPLSLAAKLIPWSIKTTGFNFSLFFHLKFHAKIQDKYNNSQNKKMNIKISKSSQINLIKSLIECIKNIKLKSINTEWNNYYNFTNYEKESFKHKKEIITKFRDIVKPPKVWDIGANTGLYSRLFAECSNEIFSLDIDPLAVEKNYLHAKEYNEFNIFPLVFDITNPSPAIGWNNKERVTLFERSNNPDLVMALALIHHLRITYNIPFDKISSLFSKIAPHLIIEFVEKEDSMVQRMLLNRKDIFNNYSIQDFEQSFMEDFEILDKIHINSSKRCMYLMRRKCENI